MLRRTFFALVVTVALAGTMHAQEGPRTLSKYEENLERLIESLRRDYDAPKAKFVLTTGCRNPGTEGLGLKIAEAELAAGH